MNESAVRKAPCVSRSSRAVKFEEVGLGVGPVSALGMEKERVKKERSVSSRAGPAGRDILPPNRNNVGNLALRKVSDTDKCVARPVFTEDHQIPDKAESTLHSLRVLHSHLSQFGKLPT